MDNSKFRTLYGEKKSPTTPKLLPITKKNYSKPIIHYTVRRYDLPTDYEDIKNKITIKNPLKYFGKEALRPIYGKLFSNPNVPLIKSSSITPTISTNEELMTNISTTDDGLSLKGKELKFIYFIDSIY